MHKETKKNTNRFPKLQLLHRRYLSARFLCTEEECIFSTEAKVLEPRGSKLAFYKAEIIFLSNAN